MLFLVGKPPFEASDTKTTYERISTVDLHFPEHVPEEAKDLISKLLCINPKERLPLLEIMMHSWIAKCKTE